MHSELDITAAGVHTDFANDVDAQVTHLLVLTVGQGQRWSHGDRVTGVHSQRVDVFNGCDNNDVVITIAHEF